MKYPFVHKEMLTNAKKYLLGKEVIIITALFFTSFMYILFFTQCVPFFFDDHQFHRDFIGKSYEEYAKQVFSLNTGGIAENQRPVYGILFKSIFPFFDYDYCSYRMVKGIIFSFLIVFMYLLARKLLVSRKIALFYAIYNMVLFPLYIQTLVYDEPSIIAEIFKIGAILLFLKDFEQKETSWLRQFFVFLFTLFAVRTYMPTYSISGILPLFTLLSDKKKFFRYTLLFFMLLLIQFPITFNTSSLDSHGIYSPKLVNIKHAFFNDFLDNISSPLPNFESLYYKSFTAILTFFGFWLLFFCFIIYVYAKWKQRNSQTGMLPEEGIRHRNFIFIIGVWMLSELPTYIFLPEHAIRYIFPFWIPFSLGILAFVYNTRKKIDLPYRKLATLLIFLFIGAAMLTNLFYVTAFRAGWGSSFFVFEEGMDYFAELQRDHNLTIGVLYASGAVAEEYFYVNKSSENYIFGTCITYIKAPFPELFQEEEILHMAQAYDEFYVIKRTTSMSKKMYPEEPVEVYPSLHRVAVFYGEDKDVFFDKALFWTVNAFGLEYKPNQIEIYKVSTS